MGFPLIAFNFIKLFKDFQCLYEDYIFTLGILRLLNFQETSFIFSLLTENLCLTNLKGISNIKETMMTLVGLNLIKKVNDKIVLNEIFRASLCKGLCESRIERIFLNLKKEQDNIEIEKISSISSMKYREILKSISSSYFENPLVREMLLQSYRYF